MANQIVGVHAGIYGIGIYAIMLPSGGFSVAHLYHFLPPGVAHTTGLSHNPFTWRPLQDGKTLTPKSSAMKSYVKLMRHPQHWYFPQFLCNMRKISAKRYRRAKLHLYPCYNSVIHASLYQLTFWSKIFCINYLFFFYQTWMTWLNTKSINKVDSYRISIKANTWLTLMNG